MPCKREAKQVVTAIMSNHNLCKPSNLPYKVTPQKRAMGLVLEEKYAYREAQLGCRQC